MAETLLNHKQFVALDEAKDRQSIIDKIKKKLFWNTFIRSSLTMYIKLAFLRDRPFFFPSQMALLSIKDP